MTETTEIGETIEIGKIGAVMINAKTNAKTREQRRRKRSKRKRKKTSRCTRLCGALEKPLRKSRRSVTPSSRNNKTSRTSACSEKRPTKNASK